MFAKQTVNLEGDWMSSGTSVLDIINELSKKAGRFNQPERDFLYESFLADVYIKKLISDEANEKCREFHKSRLYVRGVIELSNICRNKCKYCSMSAENDRLHRYMIPKQEVIETILYWAEKGMKVFHLSSGENDVYSLEDIIDILRVIDEIGARAIIVLGQKNNEELRMMKSICSNITLIEKFETSNPWLYQEYNNKNNGLEFRIQQLNQARRFGYKIGTGNIIGLPFQSISMLIDDLELLRNINPEQASTSNYIVSGESTYSKYTTKKDSIDNTLLFISFMRLLLEDRVIIPTNSSLGKDGKEKGLRSGANMVSVNLTPEKYLNDYIIYDRSRRKKADLAEVNELAERTGLIPEYVF